MFDVPFDVGAAVNVADVLPDANTPFKVVSKSLQTLLLVLSLMLQIS